MDSRCLIGSESRGFESWASLAWKFEQVFEIKCVDVSDVLSFCCNRLGFRWCLNLCRVSIVSISQNCLCEIVHSLFFRLSYFFLVHSAYYRWSERFTNQNQNLLGSGYSWSSARGSDHTLCARHFSQPVFFSWRSLICDTGVVVVESLSASVASAEQVCKSSKLDFASTICLLYLWLPVWQFAMRNFWWAV